MVDSRINIHDSLFLPKVSVIVPIYNGEKDLPSLIECIYSQTYPKDLVEYILVDNRSTDDTANIIQIAARSAHSQGLVIRYIAEDNIQCVSAARNAGIVASVGEIIAITDVDCRPLPEWLFYIVQPFANPKIGVVGGAVKSLSSETIFEDYAKKNNTLSHEFPHRYDPPFALGANHAVRRKAFEEVGLYRPYLSGCDDIDMCWRIQHQKNWSFYSQEQAIIEHRHRDSLKDLLSQWRGYGRGYTYLKELYGVELFPGWTPIYLLLGWVRWLLKGLPTTSIKILVGKATPLDVLITPIFLLTRHSEAIGRREGFLTEEMKKIEWLPKT